jgi:hypothetical protein
MGQYTQAHASSGEFPATERYAAADAKLSKDCPALAEFLTERLDDVNKPRVTSTLGISCEDGVWKCCLTDRAQAGGKMDYKLWKSGSTLLEALQALDMALRDGTAEWRKFPKWVGKR